MTPRGARPGPRAAAPHRASMHRFTTPAGRSNTGFQSNGGSASQANPRAAILSTKRPCLRGQASLIRGATVVRFPYRAAMVVRGLRATSVATTRSSSINARAAGDGGLPARVIRPMSRVVSRIGTSSTASNPASHS